MTRFIWLALITLAVGCKKEKAAQEQNGIVGRWLRTEQYVNPGNGGSWVPANDVPSVTVEFTAGGKIISNHPFYAGYTDYKRVGTDSLELTNAGGTKRFAAYTLDNEKLTVLYTCIEGCGDRFTRK